ncbi:MAG: PSD1 and planctomycete cytochrome C domain-containing protein [Planctomycetota bacterium]
MALSHFRSTSKKLIRLLSILATCLFLVSAIPALGQEETSVSFDRDIRPLLSDRCYACHGPDAGSRAADLRLDLEEESHGFAIEPGSIEDSELWHRVTSDDESDVMPPPESHKKPFNKKELALIRQWIEQGAKYESFWAFTSPDAVIPPKVSDAKWGKQPIDQFVFDSIQSISKAPSPEADFRTLIRRASLDLTGLPPTPELLRTYLRLESQVGRIDAWDQLTDELIASSRFGEHFARHWLDVVRFADTNGMHKDFYRNHFAYRDWVIRAINENLPYDQFVRDQLAGDLLDDPTKDQLTATAFNRLHLIIDRGTALPEESFHKNVIDRVTATSTAFLGLTMQCAQCHDHKYDPISQREFYSFYAFFNNLDTEPETAGYPRNGLQEPYVSLASPEQETALAKFDDELKQLDQQLASINSEMQDIEKQLSCTSTEPESNAAKTTATLTKAKTRLTKKVEQIQSKRKTVEQARNELDQTIPYAMVSKARKESRPTHVLTRGEYDSPGELVSRGTPAFLPKLNVAGEQPTRLDLANWFIDPKHPLTARVAVNRYWQVIFGRGLVKTSEDFGAQGDVPSHPELLDYLARDFVDSGWDVKRLIKKMVMSKTYRQSSAAAEQNFLDDPDNRLLMRANRYRLDAEVIRDQLLFTSGNLVETMYGPSVKPPQPDGLWASVTMIGERYVADKGDNARRRSLYTFWKRGMPPPQMTILNAPMRDSCVARRERTNTPSQALLLLNEPSYFLAGRKLAVETIKRSSGERIQSVWEKITGRKIDSDEKTAIKDLLTELTTYYEANPKLAAQICDGMDSSLELEQSQVAAWTATINAIYNLDITRTRE